MKRFLASVAGVTVALANAHTAFAQSGSSTEVGSNLELEEIVVTAERVTKDLQKVSQKITTLNGDDLKKQSKTRIDEILQGIPGIQMQQNDQINPTVYMRGINSGVPITIDGVDLTNATLVNGAAGANSYGTTANQRATQLDVSQVQVAYGVQNGAGTTSLTGAVNVMSNKPVFEYQATGSLTVGNYNERSAEGVLNLPLASDQAVRLAYTGERRDGYYASGQGDSDSRQFRMRYRWQPSNNLDVTATVQEANTGGNGISTLTLLYTGHWINYTGQDLAWTNPYNGVSSTWTSNQIRTTGLVNAANSLYTGSTYTVSGSNLLNSSNQYLYNSGPCSNSAVVNSITGSYFSRVPTATTGLNSINSLGPVITAMDCPYRELAIRDGVNYDQRSNPWDDGFRQDMWSNGLYRSTVQRVANVAIDWQTSYGKWTFQPSYVYNLNNSVQQSRLTLPTGAAATAAGAAWFQSGYIPTRSYALDVQLASNADSKLAWVGGFSGAYVPRPDDGFTNILVSMPSTGWGTASTTAAAVNSNCYTVTPNATSTTAAGTPNANECLSPNYVGGVASYKYGLSLQLSYPVLDQLRVNGSVRHDWYGDEIRGAFGADGTTLVDGNGQRYMWYVPATTVGACTTANPNGCLVVPQRMNLSRADMDAIVNSVHYWRKSGTNSFTVNAEYDVLPSAMLYTKFATGTQKAQARVTGANTTLGVTLPDAVIPGTSTHYTTNVTLPRPSMKGEETTQLSLGLKSRWFDNKLQVNIEGFDNRYKNRPLGLLTGLYSWTNAAGVTSATGCAASVAVPLSVQLGAATNASDSCFASNAGSFVGDMLSRGVDLDVSYLPTIQDRIDFQGEYLRTTFSGAPTVPTLTTADVLALNTGSSANATVAQFFADGFNNYFAGLSGKTLQQAPQLSLNLSYQHEFELPGGSRLTPKVLGYYKSAYFFTSPATTTGEMMTTADWCMRSGHEDSCPWVQKAYTLWDAYLNWQPKDGKWFINAYVKNIANRAIKSSISGISTTGGGVSTGSIATNDYNFIPLGGFVALNPPRTFGVTLQASF